MVASPRHPASSTLRRMDFHWLARGWTSSATLQSPHLVYGRRLHVISLLAIPDAKQGDRAKEVRSINGYNVVSWREGGMGYWAISDLAVGELETFVRLFIASPS